ncbi:hypothetical protein GCM10020331_012220 [Ectobacillus funiculus]
MSEFIHLILFALMSLGYIGIALGLMVEVIPSEIVLAYAGYLVSQGKVTFLGAVIAGTVGGLIAQLFFCIGLESLAEDHSCESMENSFFYKGWSD